MILLIRYDLITSDMILLAFGVILSALWMSLITSGMILPASDIILLASGMTLIASDIILLPSGTILLASRRKIYHWIGFACIGNDFACTLDSLLTWG